VAGAGALLAAAAWPLGPVPAALAAVAVALARRWRRLAAQQRQRQAQIDEFADAIDMIVLAIRAGHTPANAVRAVCPSVPAVLRAPFGIVLERNAAGERFADALTALPAVLGPIAEPLADALTSADRYGQPLAPVLDRLAGDARVARRQRAEAAARQLPVRLAAPLVLCTLPSFVLLAIVPLLLGTFTSLHT